MASKDVGRPTEQERIAARNKTVLVGVRIAAAALGAAALYGFIFESWFPFALVACFLALAGPGAFFASRNGSAFDAYAGRQPATKPKDAAAAREEQIVQVLLGGNTETSPGAARRISSIKGTSPFT